MQLVETAAYLGVVTCLRDSLVNDTAPQLSLFQLYDDDQPQHRPTKPLVRDFD
jgi:hypothetical protein